MVMGEATIDTKVAVIGAGPGGYAAAFRAADLGLDVTMVHLDERLGGVCLLRGCIPSKALLYLTELVHDARQAKDMGIDFCQPEIDVDGVRAWKDSVVDRLTKGLDTLSKRRDVQLVQGRAVFESSSKLRVTGPQTTHITFEHAILATGSRARALPGTEFKEGARIMSSTGALQLADIPERLLVIGAGYVGMELGSVYAAMGSRVTVVELRDEILPGTDRDLVRPFERKAEQIFEAIQVRTKVAEIEEKEEHVRVVLEGDVDEPEQTFDRVLVAIGRGPNSDDIGLEKTGVELDDRGFVRVDEQQRTADQKIFAIGDVVGGMMLAHKAMYEGKVAAEVIAGEPAAFDVRAIPAVVYTDPSIAWAGLMEPQAEKEGREIAVARFPWGASGRALTMGAPEGLTKMIFDPDTEHILGVGIVGRDAGEMIAEGVLAIEMGAVAADLDLSIHAHPTLSETEEEAAGAFLGHATHILPR
ncbi:MAG: dihydrolipoyl dehydrogenase [Anaerolineae bacterium]|nr:dihydrolipoyl dehydrogenase [Anaerolineae bacterium]